MAAIRATGGVKGAGLKKVEIDPDKKTTDTCEQGSSSKSAITSQSEDLMSSLARVLALRRKGMIFEGEG